MNKKHLIFKGKRIKYQTNFLTLPYEKENYIVYGFLYNRYVVVNEPNITNTGWRVPSKTDAETLLNYINNNYDTTSFGASSHLKSERTKSSSGNPNVGITTEEDPVWKYDENYYGRNTVNFNAVPSGLRGFININEQVEYWLTTIGVTSSEGRTAVFTYTQPGNFAITGNRPFTRGFSIKILRDTTPSENSLDDGSYLDDYQGNDLTTYKTVKIGNQVWLSENLMETKYNDGSWITGFDGGSYTQISDVDWSNLQEGALCAYENNLDYVYVLK